MDRDITLAVPARVVFDHLADPFHLGDWLPQVIRVVAPVPAPLIGAGCSFTLTLRTAHGTVDVEAEIVEHEPPWMVSFLLVGASPLLLRATCTSGPGGTRVHLWQTEGSAALQIDLQSLRHALPERGSAGPRP